MTHHPAVTSRKVTETPINYRTGRFRQDEAGVSAR
ncbi:hypothetical protein EDD95_8181 [Streptomyces sp. CEV 2-1]|nr:hypothetical protein EDD95_8181 [Streptomyces sp. CEV 2-1]